MGNAETKNLIEAQKSPTFKSGMNAQRLPREILKNLAGLVLWNSSNSAGSRRVLGNYLKRISQHFTLCNSTNCEDLVPEIACPPLAGEQFLGASREQPEKPRALARGGSLNILYVSSFGSLQRGGQISLWNLLYRLDRAKFRPILVCSEEGDLVSSCQDMDIPTFIVSLPPIRIWRISSILSSLIKMSQIIKSHKIEIVHCDDLRQVIYFGILKIFYRVPVIWHIRVSWRNVISDTIGFYLSKRVICTAQIIADKFRHLPGFEGKVTTIYNSLDVNYFKPIPIPELREKYNIGPQDFVIGVVSRLDPVKGIHFLIEAVPQIKIFFNNIKLIVVGDGAQNYKQSLEKRIKELGINDSVIFIGFKKDVRPFLNMLDLFILPTMEKEGSSRSILEAMACSLPVLTTDTGGNRELVIDKETGIIIPRADPVMISSEASRLLSNRENLLKMGRQARDRAIKKFNISENIRLTENIYLTLS